MNKFLICIIMIISAANICYSTELELSDVIKEARKAENLKVSQSNENIQPVKNEIQSLKGEQNACEKINPQELLPQKTVNN